ncbi:MAG: glucose-1-phosphate cytidylyltransferase [Deltaproteobacteria bacterium]|nr:glucose-1-phosphate cytidylyltransferase [Deltaproteobacteria bacterium]
MKVVILAGGLGTRLGGDTALMPKPMVEIGGRPILWHIMKIYSHFGMNDFVILLGYKGYVIKEYFANYFLHRSDVTIDLCTNSMETHNNRCEPWKVTLMDTGLKTQTGGRLRRIRDFIGNETFMVTYGDGVADIDVNALLKYHRSHGKAATLTAVQPEGRFGRILFESTGRINNFREKPLDDHAWVNGGFFVCEPEMFRFIEGGDDTIFERAPLQNLAAAGELFAYKHEGSWLCMDTPRDKKLLNEIWEKDKAFWKLW